MSNLPSSQLSRPQPRCTYRLQLSATFGFDKAAEILSYLARLGVTHAYTSPYLLAAPGSTHGYDVVDYEHVNSELGGGAGHSRFLAALAKAHLSLMVDLVPNHMAIAAGNDWWQDVLEHGRASRYASHFDVDWDPPESRLRNVILLPVLPDHYGRVLERGGIQLTRRQASFSLTVGDQRFPVDPRSLGALLTRTAIECRCERLAFIGEALSDLPPATVTDAGSVRRRCRDSRLLLEDLDRLAEEQSLVAETLDHTIAQINGDNDALDSLVEQQNYRLAWWRSARRDLGYRRFFDIDPLIGLRIENEEVFHETHRTVLDWVVAGQVDGLRIDHIDGLRDPAQYLRRLRGAAPRTWIVVEKILAPDEQLPPDWPVDGTTGYDFLNRLGGLFVDPNGEATLTALYAEFTGQPSEYVAVERERKLMVLRDVLGSDVNRLAALFLTVCERHRRYRDFTRHDLTEALRETIASFHVYRTYIRPDAPIEDTDARHVQEAAAQAKQARPDLDSTLFDFLRDVLLQRVTGPLESELTMRLQQLSGAAMAKGVEDTAFYCYGRFIALNEVGAHPDRFGCSAEAFHEAMADAHRHSPLGLLATATHDTKRGEDVRARLYLLSEIPEQWATTVHGWSAELARYRTDGWPDRLMEYVFYQTAVGAWPLTTDRSLQYMEKASREAKMHTSWTQPNPAYDTALRRFVEGALSDARFVASLGKFVDSLLAAGRTNSLAQTLVKLTAPGIPDVYQGTELWSLDLVDPDNRQPVDYVLRQRLLDELEHDDRPETVWGRADEGLPKLHVISRALALRQRRPTLFGPEGTYKGLVATGQQADHVIAFVRGGGAITVVPRLVFGLASTWGDTALDVPAGGWRNELTGDHINGGRLQVADLLARFPVALLARV